ncbi:Rieske (2Fe-2S) protein [Corynebacterium sp. A21]|uniref:Rieske (2Fe-2S) protein n=1 Tax=Corynebacterium sp. A21 TaxID=3457318 RepID=UPI003FCF2192
MFLLGTATTFAGAFLAACGSNPTAAVAATEVPVGSAVIIDSFIVAQPTAGNFLAYSATCPHQNNSITEVEGENVRCTAHNSVFSTVDGAVIEGPSREPLTAAQVHGEAGTLSLSN